MDRMGGSRLVESIEHCLHGDRRGETSQICKGEGFISDLAHCFPTYGHFYMNIKIFLVLCSCPNYVIYVSVQDPVPWESCSINMATHWWLPILSPSIYLH